MAKRKFQKIEVREYGDDWVNRLAVILAAFSEMDEAELSATLNFVVQKYQRVVR